MVFPHVPSSILAVRLTESMGVDETGMNQPKPPKEPITTFNMSHMLEEIAVLT